MVLQQQIDKTREYLDYLEENINNIKKAWKEIQQKCKDMNIVYDDFYYNWLNDEVHWHDASKMSEEEFTQYRKKFYPTDIEKQEAVEKGVKIDITAAFEHHKAKNPHHWENWTKLKSHSHPEAWCIHCAHMVIDWMAMGYKFGDTAQQYYEKNKDKIKLPDYAIDFIYEIFKRLNQRREYRVYMDGDKWCAVGPNFTSLQESPAGFGDTPSQAIDNLDKIMEENNG